MTVQVAQKQHMDVVFKFLGMRNLSAEEWEKVMGMPIKNVGKKRGDMLQETRQLLKDFYAPFNQKLATQLKDDRFLWND